MTREVVTGAEEYAEAIAQMRTRLLSNRGESPDPTSLKGDTQAGANLSPAVPRWNLPPSTTPAGRIPKSKPAGDFLEEAP